MAKSIGVFLVHSYDIELRFNKEEASKQLELALQF